MYFEEKVDVKCLQSQLFWLHTILCAREKGGKKLILKGNK